MTDGNALIDKAEKQVKKSANAWILEQLTEIEGR